MKTTLLILSIFTLGLVSCQKSDLIMPIQRDQSPNVDGKIMPRPLSNKHTIKLVVLPIKDMDTMEVVSNYVFYGITSVGTYSTGLESSNIFNQMMSDGEVKKSKYDSFYQVGGYLSGTDTVVNTPGTTYDSVYVPESNVYAFPVQYRLWIDGSLVLNMTVNNTPVSMPVTIWAHKI